MELVHAEDELGERDPFRSRWSAPLSSGGVGLQVCAIYVGTELERGDALRAVLRQASAFHRATEANRDTAVGVETAADLDLIGDDRLGLVLALEGASALGEDLWLLEVLAQLGVRMACLTWNERNALASGCDHDGGLTSVGAEAVRRMIDLGWVVDLAHASSRTARDVLDSVGEEPVIVSHAACRALYNHARNVDDELILAVAERGGMIGLMPHPYVLGADASLATFLDHVDHAVAAGGIDHVGLGGDFLRQIARTVGFADVVEDGMAMDAALDELEGPQDYPALIAGLRDRGYRDEQLTALLGGNLLRVLGRRLPQA